MIVCVSRTGLAEITAANFTLFTMGPAEDRHASIFIFFQQEKNDRGRILLRNRRFNFQFGALKRKQTRLLGHEKLHPKYFKVTEI